MPSFVVLVLPCSSGEETLGTADHANNVQILLSHATVDAVTVQARFRLGIFPLRVCAVTPQWLRWVTILMTTEYFHGE